MSTPPPPPPPPTPPSRPARPLPPPKPEAVQPVSEARAEAIFNGAVALPESAQAEFLAVECRGEEALLRRVQVLLAAHADESELLAEPQLTPEIEAQLARLKPEEEGERIANYKLLQQIGEGGFGTVWMADQLEPVQRRVALKIIKLGMDTREVIGRFEQERQALAMMDHPNIAKVFDAGATQYGRPFFVMELVKGIPITQYCDEAGLGMRERLALFRDVCSAIQHAHQKGIIHRDIKPSNVMVTLYADRPVVKVIDFGIAKATQSKLTDKTLFTRFEQFIGTPVYMSPEQASLSAVDIDTRSDIYALGILLYELLTGKPPFDAHSLASAGYEEMRRIIREVEPPKPSSRLSTVLGEERTSIARARHIAPEKLSRLVEPDLDWIVMKAIEKDRTRRYETANGLAADIGRFLADEAVTARPPSAAYQFRKFARRHRAALRVAATIAAVLVVATGVSTLMAIRATKAEKQATETLTLVTAERDAKEQARRDSEEIAAFLGNVFQSPDPARDGRTITVAETLDKAAKKLDTDLAAQPGRRAKLQVTLGRTYLALGLARQAIPLQEEAHGYFLAALGPEHPDTLAAMSSLAASYFAAGRREEALKLREEVLRRSRKKLGLEHPATIKAISNLANSYHYSLRHDEALKMREEVLALSRKVSGPEHPDTLSAMNNLATSYLDAGYRNAALWGEALKLYEEALRLSRKINGPEHPATLAAMNNLAICYGYTGRSGEILKLREEVLALHLKISGPDHPDTFGAMLNLTNSYVAADRNDEALRMGEEVLARSRKVLGPEHPSTLTAMVVTANSYGQAGRWDEALTLREEGVALSRTVLGSEHRETLLAMGSLAVSLENARRWDEALKLREEILLQARKQHDPEHPDTLNAMGNVANDFWEVGRRDEAIKLREELLPIRRKVNGPEHAATLELIRSLANSYRAQGEVAKAKPLEQELVAAEMKKFWGDRLTDARVTRLRAAGLKPRGIQRQPDKSWAVDLTGLKDFTDLTIFEGKRISRLTLKGTGVIDLAPLRGLPLKQLDLEGTRVTDLTPLQGLPLEELVLTRLPISDLTALRGLPLQRLAVNGTAVADLEPLRGMPLKNLAIHDTKATDLQPLQDMPLDYLNLINTAVTDLTALRGMPLTNVRMTGCKQLTDLTPLTEARGLTLLTLPPNAKNIEFLRTFPKLERLSYSQGRPETWFPAQTTAEFWKEFDAGKK